MASAYEDLVYGGPAPAAAAPDPASAPAGAPEPSLADAVTAAAPKKKGGGVGTYESLSELVNYYKGIGDAGKTAKYQTALDAWKAANPDYDTSGVNVNQFGGYEDYAPGGPTSAMERYLLQERRRQLQTALAGGKDVDIDQAMNRFRLKLNKDLEANMKAQAQKELMPSLDKAQAKADELVGGSAIDAGAEQAMRSRIAAQVETAEAQRSAKIGATLGFGNMANSPAAASLAADAAQDADRTAVSILRDLSLDVARTNREEARRDADLATRIALSRWNVINGDSKSLMGMRGEIAEMIDALYSRDQTMDLMERELEESSNESLGDRIGQWGGTLGGLAEGAGGLMQGIGAL